MIELCNYTLSFNPFSYINNINFAVCVIKNKLSDLCIFKSFLLKELRGMYNRIPSPTKDSFKLQINSS